MTTLLYFIKDYDMVQKDQVMAIIDEKHSVETASVVATILQPSKVATMGDNT